MVLLLAIIIIMVIVDITIVIKMRRSLTASTVSVTESVERICCGGIS